MADLEELRNRYRRKFGCPRIETNGLVAIGYYELKGCYVCEKSITVDLSLDTEKVWEIIIEEKQALDKIAEKYKNYLLSTY